MDIKEFLKSKFGTKKQILVKSDNGDFITPEQKAEQENQKAEAEKHALKEQERKVNQDIREALSFVNYESTIIKKTNNQSKQTICKTTRPQKEVTPHSKPASQNIDIDTDIDVPLMKEHPRTAESNELDHYAKEAAKLLDYTFHVKTNSTKRRSTIQHKKKSTQSTQEAPKTKVQGFDMDR